MEAGLVLKGYEVKAIKSGKASIKGAYVKIVGGRPQLIGATISPYQPANTPADMTQLQAGRFFYQRKKSAFWSAFRNRKV